jgi:hypothetical protein
MVDGNDRSKPFNSCSKIDQLLLATFFIRFYDYNPAFNCHNDSLRSFAYHPIINSNPRCSRHQHIFLTHQTPQKAPKNRRPH